MRRFSSYGEIDTDLHYYAPREEFIQKAYTQLLGEHPEKGGLYMTVWAPRQTGKSWVMQQILFRLRQDIRFDVVKINLDTLKTKSDLKKILRYISEKLTRQLGKTVINTESVETFENLFTRETLDKPLILILDEFDALAEDAISSIAGIFRNIYLSRQEDPNPQTGEKDYLLHGLALIGVRSVLGIENVRGSPFNVQRSLHIPNLTYDEVNTMFKWYERESGHRIEHNVIDRLYYETGGQPGLTCWLGELLTEGHELYQVDKTQPVTMEQFEEMYAAALHVLPNNNILNILSKANTPPYTSMVLKLFQTEEKRQFKYDNPMMNYLYMNGVITPEKSGKTNYDVKFASPFVQKRLFNYFSDTVFEEMGKVRNISDSAADVFDNDQLNIRNLMIRFEAYLKQNRDWLLKDAPKRKDLRVYEAVYHFCFYRYLCDFLRTRQAKIYPEFPTGNGKIDLLIKDTDRVYGLELKSYTDETEYHKALKQAAQYGKESGFSEIWLISFVEYADKATRQKYEREYVDQETGVTVMPLFVETGR